jgi:Putative viral replication protein
MNQSTVWCFTINNPSDNQLPTTWSNVKDAIWQLEAGEADTEHLQGFVRFSKTMRLSAVKKLDARAHWEPCKAPVAAVEYCSKDETRVDGPWTIGTPKGTQGKRQDLADAVAAIKAGTPVHDIVAENPSLLRVKRALDEFAREERNIKGKESMEQLVAKQTLRPWQQQLFDILEGETDDRTMIWVHEPVGNVGKSSFCNHSIVKQSACVLQPGRKADLCFVYDRQPIVIFDCSRTSSEGGMDVVYNLCENIKDGRIFSTKYESVMKIFKPPHVVIFSNSEPDWEKWSVDRYAVYLVEDGHLEHQVHPSLRPPARGIVRQNGMSHGFNP